MARERQAHREGIELSQAVHDTTAQTAYMIGLGIYGAMRLAGDSNPKLTERLAAAAALSRSATWELRGPIEMGRIFEGRDLTRVLGAHTATFADADRKLVARLPGRPDRQRFPKDDLGIDLEAGNCTCPAGQATHKIVLAGRRTDEMGRVHRLRAFQFDGSECMTCPLRSHCISPRGRKGR